jgi:hypothetical protein
MQRDNPGELSFGFVHFCVHSGIFVFIAHKLLAVLSVLKEPSTNTI